MKLLALIPARGGSRGISGKNIIDLAGVPLIGWTIAAANDSRFLDRVVVSTDSPEIRRTSESLGAETPFLRPAELATDESPSLDTVVHALNWFQTEQQYFPDAVVLLQPTSPLRTGQDIDAAVTIFSQSAQPGDSVMSVTLAPMHPDLMMRKDNSGFLVNYRGDGANGSRRQDFDAVYALNGAIYITWSTDLLSAGSIKGKRVIPYVMPAERSVDIDSEWELELCRWRIQSRPQHVEEL